LEIRRQLKAVDYFALFSDLGDPSQGYMVRQLNATEWTMTQIQQAKAAWDLEEVISV
jgi:hypothetical protein